MHDNRPIKITGARQHNLKNVTISIPRNSLTVITGLSGSGKSSLAFDTLFAEGQRRYVESLSSYARQFLDTLEKPEFDTIEGLSPTIAIDQKTASHNPRSTVGTITEVYDFLRLLFSRCGTPHCPHHPKEELVAQTSEQILQRMLEDVKALGLPQKVVVYAPLISDKRGEHKYALKTAQKAKIDRVRIDGTSMTIEEALTLDIDRNKRHSIEAEILTLGIYSEDRETVKELEQGVLRALQLGNGLTILFNQNTGEEKFYSEHYTCPECGFSLPTIEPRLFSFNSPHGACPVCQGLGTRLEFDQGLILPNPRLTLGEGAIRPWSRITSHSNWYQKSLSTFAIRYKVSLTDTPVGELTEKQLHVLLYGDMDNASIPEEEQFEGIIPNLRRRYDETDSDYLRQEIEKYMVVRTCPSCHGQRLRAEILGITVQGKNIVDINGMTIEELSAFLTGHTQNDRNQMVYEQLAREITQRLGFLLDVGLGYLTLDRSASTLAGGEAQRIRLATQLGSQLMGVIYVLDEPSIGLHVRDHERLLKTLFMLRDIGNTVVVVEHDEQTMKAADYIIDIGPGAGEKGGQLIAAGTPDEVMSDTNSLTGAYLSGRNYIEVPPKRRKAADKWLTVHGAEEFNLKNVTVKFPLERFVVVAGVSGSGKSTLVADILARALSVKFHRAKVVPGKHQKITGMEHIDKVIDIDQSPIGRTPRSNPVTYTGIFGPIRELFAETPAAIERNFDAGHFSFNLRGGRCETCKGDGVLKIEMNFLPDVYVTCSECKGRRYNQEAMEVLYNGKSIADVLDMTIDEAVEFFKQDELIHHKLSVLQKVGLGYMRLGQPATTLSGGEAQRIKLATELSRQSTGHTLYILDEPTTGLHFEDNKRLLAVLQALVDKGNSVIVVEHDMDVIKSADWIIDIGPDGGDKGGSVVAEGTPEQVAKVTASHTGRALAEVLAASKQPATSEKVPLAEPLSIA
ncbi:MAG TPA: excinuclease ABC subunit UvrA [Patescibacteria group bacterium]